MPPINLHNLGNQELFGIALEYKKVKGKDFLSVKPVESPLTDTQGETLILIGRWLLQNNEFRGYKIRDKKSYDLCCGSFCCEKMTRTLYRLCWHPKQECFNHAHNNSSPSDDDNPSPPQNL